MATKLYACFIKPFGTSVDVIEVYADPGMEAVIEKVEGIGKVVASDIAGRYIVTLDPRYNRVELLDDIEKAVTQ